MTDNQAKAIALRARDRKSYGPAGDAELNRLYTTYRATALNQRYELIKAALRRTEDDHFYCGPQEAAIEQKVGCLEYEYLIMKGLIVPVLA